MEFLSSLFAALLEFLFSTAGLYTVLGVLGLLLLGWVVRSVADLLNGRAAAKRKTKAIDARLDPLVKAVTDAGAKRERGPSPDLTALRDAAAALVAEIDAVRVEVIGLPTAAPSAPSTPVAAPSAPRKPQVFLLDDAGNPITDEAPPAARKDV